MNWLKRYISWPLLLAVAFLTYVLFLNDNSLLADMEYAEQERELMAKISACEDTLLYYEQLNSKLDTDPVELEKIVREHYHMQLPSEDVYIFE